MPTNDPELLVRVAMTYFEGGTQSYLLGLARRRARPKKEQVEAPEDSLKNVKDK
jgi:hypothetical protein